MDAASAQSPFHSCWRDKSDIPAGADALVGARRQRRSRSATAAREAGRLDGRVLRRARIETGIPTRRDDRRRNPAIRSRSGEKMG